MKKRRSSDPKIATMQAEHETVFARMSEIINSATVSKRNLTADELAEYDKLEARFDDLSERLSKVAETDPIVNPGNGRPDLRKKATLGREERMEDWARSNGHIRADQDEPLSFQKFVRGLVTGQWADADAERRAMSEGTLANGGYLVPTPLSARIIDMARGRARVLQAGATTVPMDAQTLKLARWAGDPSAAWHTENTLIAQSDAQLESVTLTARALASHVTASWELIEDAAGIDTALEDAFSQQLSLTLDKAALYGSGTAPEPRGVKNTTGVTLTAAGANGAAVSYDHFIDAKARLAQNNENCTAFIDNPRTEASLAKLKDADQNYLRPPEYISSVPRYDTTQVPIDLTQGTATNASDLFAADWPQLLVGIRHSFEIKVLQERYADYGQIGFIAWLRADVLVARPKAFDVTTGLIP